MSEKTAEAIQIGDGRYAIIIHNKDGMLCQHELERFDKEVHDWWDSGEKFLIMQDGPLMGLELRRVEAA